MLQTGKNALLIPGLYSCEKDEQSTTLVCIIEPFQKVVTINRYSPEYGYYRNVKEIHTFIRVMSKATHKCYDIDVDFADIVETENEYQYHREFEMLDSMLNEEFLDMYDYADDYM